MDLQALRIIGDRRMNVFERRNIRMRFGLNGRKGISDVDVDYDDWLFFLSCFFVFYEKNPLTHSGQADVFRINKYS